MLILNNGVPKSGSTWIQKIIVKAVNPAFPPQEWRNGWSNPSIDPERLSLYVKSGEWRETPTLIKTHLPYKRNLDYLADPDIKVIVSYRNVADSVLSRFHHHVRKGAVSKDDMPRWLETEGRGFAQRILKYRSSWAGRENALFLAYEDMVQDAPAGVAAILAFLGMPKSTEDCQHIARVTQARSRKGKEPREGKHVRTAGRSAAEEELPRPFFLEFEAMERASRAVQA